MLRRLQLAPSKDLAVPESEQLCKVPKNHPIIASTLEEFDSRFQAR